MGVGTARALRPKANIAVTNESFMVKMGWVGLLFVEGCEIYVRKGWLVAKIWLLREVLLFYVGIRM